MVGARPFAPGFRIKSDDHELGLAERLPFKSGHGVGEIADLRTHSLSEMMVPRQYPLSTEC